MSRHPSPGPSHSGPQNTQQGPSAASVRRSRPAHSVGIAAGAEDVKYQAKYKDLKRKVKEIEGENDKLHFKILQAKRSLQRMKLERAILYERLAAASPSADPHDRHSLNQVPSGPPLPPHPQPSRSYSGSHQGRDVRDRPMPMDSDPAPVDYLRQHGNPRPPAQDPSRPVPPMDPPPLSGNVVPSPHMSSVQSPRRNSGGHDASRHLPPLPHLPPVGQVGQYESAGRSHSLPHAGSPPIPHAHLNSTPSHDRGRSQSSRPHQPLPQTYSGVPGQHYSEALPPVQRVLHSPPPHSDRDRPPRRLEGNGYQPTHNESHMQHSRHSSQVSPHLHPVESRTSSSRVHPHQRLGPSAYINREDSIPRQYEGRERDSRGDWERDPRGREPSGGRDINPNIHSPHAARRAPPPLEYPEHPHPHHVHQTQSLPPRLREEQVYYHEGNPYPSVHASRSDTPGSGSGSGIGAGEGPSRPDSRTQFYEQDRNRPSYRLRPVSQSNNNEDVEFVGHDDVRSQSRDPSNAHPHPSSSTPTTAAGGNSNTPASGVNSGTSGSSTISGGGGNNYSSAPPTGSGIPPISERAQTPNYTETSRKRGRAEMEMDVDSENDVGGSGGADTESRRNTPGPGFSGVAGGGGAGGMLQVEDRDRGSSKRYQREHPHHRNVDNREASAPPTSAGAAGGPQDQQDGRMANS
ncbi:hypothetical protein P691DRAFT_669870 [Macrolepiota fuliginosa MF-IS2]|uniref:INO80 complex subunit F domain-containing protein n=1 Tax=Macrolepiota fuliginosa MF-IS2 TaxID=1400762 RepID=A0A9P5XDR2_9AGAR|nr:hypothetical protein P691DRAFT_669870 [Macrolepiota fuliginosa MF-IS2]